MEARIYACLHTKRLNGVSHLTLDYIEGWMYGRSYDNRVTYFGLPFLLTNGAPRALSALAELRYISYRQITNEIRTMTVTDSLIY